MKKKTKSFNCSARFNSLLQQRVIAVLKIKPEGIPADRVAEAAGCSSAELYVWYANHGRRIPGITSPTSSMLGWDQSEVVAAEE